jgi:hypothetical protein
MIVIEGDTIPELANLIVQRTPGNDPEWISAITTDLEHRLTSSIIKMMDGAALLVDWEACDEPGFKEHAWNEIAAAFMIVGMCRAELMFRVEMDLSSEWVPDDQEATHIDLILRADH